MLSRGVDAAVPQPPATLVQPRWKYVNVRRLLIFVEESIDEGTQWVVFEPNDRSARQRVSRAFTRFARTGGDVWAARTAVSWWQGWSCDCRSAGPSLAEVAADVGCCLDEGG
jgi:hypothetical protein